jgi:hypothetical protein
METSIQQRLAGSLPRLTRVAALVIASFALQQLCIASVDLGKPSEGTPYDRYMEPVRQVLGQLDGRHAATMNRARELMREGFRFHYSMTTPYEPALPEVTERRHSGDCKDMALWLADQLNDPNVRFVVGKARSTSQMKHAWLMWQGDGRWWILDCSSRFEPIAADKVSSKEYIPFYSYAKKNTYRHGDALPAYATEQSRPTPKLAASLETASATVGSRPGVRANGALDANRKSLR